METRFAGPATLLVAALAAPVASTQQVTSRVSVDSAGMQANSDSGDVSISTDGRFVSFWSASTNFFAGDTNTVTDVFVRDRIAGTTELVSVATAGTIGNHFSTWSSVSDDGRWVAFSSLASNLVAGDGNFSSDVFLRDRVAGTTVCLSVEPGGAPANSNSYEPSMSADGRYVAFWSSASDLVPGDTNGGLDAFVRDRVAGTTERVSVAAGGAQVNGDSSVPSISADGRFVAFASTAGDLVAGDTNGTSDIFVHDRLSSATERVSVPSGGGQSDEYSGNPSISADGRFVAFWSRGSNLVDGDTNGVSDIFLRDRLAATTIRVSVTTGGAQGNGLCEEPWISADGRFVAFVSLAGNLVVGDTNSKRDVFLRDRIAGTTGRMSVSTGGVQGNGSCIQTAISGDGRFVVFGSTSNNLVPGDTNGAQDVFLRDRDAASFTSLCDPGVGGVIGCPCSNPPSGAGRGCDNSAATGGAVLAASGAAYLAGDSLVFTTSGEKPTALSLLAQWMGGSAPGVTFGQGVRCTSGSFKRLFSKNAVGGSITVPDFGAGDPTVSARSAAKGDTILAGASRWYLVYYRDNTVLGGCPATSNFNSTQTGRVTWWP